MILAPMAGVTDAAFRHVCIDYGCKRAFCEMVSVNALNYKSERTYDLLKKADNETSVNVQIFGGDPQLMADMAKEIACHVHSNIECIDINMGCPMPKIVKCGYGSALLKDVSRAAKIVEAVKAVGITTSVKMRIGFKGRDIDVIGFAKAMEDAGADLIAVHGRTADQLYSGNADWDAIKRVKQALNIPVVGNGDLFSAAQAQKMQQYSGCDDVLIARGAMGNPFIFSGRDEVEDSERIETAIKHLNLCLHYKDERTAVLQMRKHIAWYIKNQRGSSAVRCKINTCKSRDEIYDILMTYKDNLEKIFPYENKYFV